MIKIKVEIWTVQGFEISNISDSNVRSELEIEIESELSIKEMLFLIADSYPSIKENIFEAKTKNFNGAFLFKLNNRIFPQNKINEKILRNGDKISIVPIIAGG